MGFSADWLNLREPADHAARDGALLDAAARAAGPAPVIVDLGCGTGSSRRAMAGRLPEAARWRMVDADPALLDLAGRHEATTTHRIDLRRIEDLPLEGATLVTASALIDLTSADWLDGLIARLAALRLPFYAALSYDGEIRFQPPHHDDAAVTAAFNRHQRGDKGFGRALGPDATDHASATLRAAGYRVETAASPWRLGPDQAPLQHALLTGIAEAAAEAGAECDVAGWVAARGDPASRSACVVGHRDLLALPAGLHGASAGDADRAPNRRPPS